MPELVIPAEFREKTGKNESRRLRRQGRIPAVVYGLGKPTAALQLDPKDILNILHSPKGTNTLFKIQERDDAEGRMVMLRDYQYHPVTGDLLHVDLVRVDVSKPVEVEVPVETYGIAPGIKDEGGFLTIVLREIELRCLPSRIPDSVRIDISNLHLHGIVRIRDVNFGEGVEVLHEPEIPLLTIQEPVKEPEPEEAEAAAVEAEAAAEEPEVIGRGKKVAEGEEAPAEGKEPAEEKEAAAKKGKEPAKEEEAAAKKGKKKEKGKRKK
ncbi:MAG: 50S ribosomal protein L25 [Acidobacteriota bacterium]|nr:MAG: 50S ribosomal protein L25 [Acidobacteriota bacterium]